MPTDDPPTREDFERCLDKILDDARHGMEKGNDTTVTARTPKNDKITFQVTVNGGRHSIVIQAGKLHRVVGGYPGGDSRMPVCCGVMRRRMRGGDERLPDSLKRDGASMQIRYLL